MAGRHASVVQIFAHEPELLEHVPSAEAEAARHRTVVTCLSLPVGEVQPPAVRSDAFDLGMLVLDGLMLHRVEVAGGRTVELLGAGDLIRPWRERAEERVIRVGRHWRIAEQTQLAVLDRRFEQDVARWPGVVAGLLERLAARAEALSVQLALAQLPRLEARLLLMLWHIADRFGTVGPDGVALPMLTQETLAEMTASRRPSVNGALARLRDRGLIASGRPGQWILLGDPEDAADFARANRLVSLA
jgi:CRP/FNR family transcriptional regulator, cyclic AMP receptor protein